MRRASGLLLVVATAALAGGAKAEDAGGLLLFGFAGALFLLLGLPVGLALHAFRREWIAKVARAAERAATWCVVVGALLFSACVIATFVFAPRAPLLAYLVVAAAVGWLFVGFAGCARRHGERMLGASDGLRPLVLGWLARAGLFAVPVAWPIVGTYLVVTAFGAPLVALFSKDDATPTT
jgi:hypothetical protein